MNLMYNNKTDIKITRDQMDYLPEPERMGRFHKPYAFAEYLDDISDALDDHNILVTDEEYVIQKDQQRLFGMMAISTPAEDWSLVLGVRGSHDQSIPRGIALGTSVLVCSNLCFSGELFTGKAKQTINNSDRILQLINDGIASIDTAYDRQEQQFATMKHYKWLTKEKVDHIMVEAFRRGALSGSQMAVAIKEYEKPSYAEHAEQGDTWKLFNAFTQAIKPKGQGVDMNGIVRKTTIISNLMNEVIK